MNLEEFIRCVSTTTRGTLSEQVEWVFQLYDIDGNQRINIQDIIDILKAANIQERSEAELSDIFEKMDMNKDNFLSYDEFSNGSLNDLTFLKLIGMKKHERRGSIVSLSSVKSFLS